MKNVSLLLAFLVCSLSLASTAFGETFVKNFGFVNPTLDDSSPTGYYSPKNFKEAIAELNKMLPDSLKDSIKSENYRYVARRFSPLAQWLFQNWGFADSSAIFRYFDSIGAWRPSELPYGILQAYWKYLNGKKIKIEIKPKVYSIGKNLFLIPVDSLDFPAKPPTLKGTIRPVDSTPQFIFMGKKFSLIDSLYDPIIALLDSFKLKPSDSLWYAWWTKIAKFEKGDDSLPSFVSDNADIFVPQEGYSYNADFVLAVEEAYTPKIRWVVKNNKFREFKNYVLSKRHLGFYLIRARKVAFLDPD